ncbi:MAG: Dps family protein [Microscillaceae bacterium]
MFIQIGINPENRQAIHQILNRLLADLTVLHTKTKNFHWNIQGPHFLAYHEMLDEQAEVLEEMIDETAERTKALGGHALGSLKEYLELTQLVEHLNTSTHAATMLAELRDDYETLIRFLRENIGKIGDQYQDEGTADFLTGQMEKHEKTAWFLRAHLAD